MRIAVKDIERFIANIPKNIRAILFYGPDAGLAKHRSTSIEKLYNSTDKFKYEQIKATPSLLLDGLRSVSLFDKSCSSNKLAIIEFSGSALAEPLLTILRTGNYSGMIVCLAGDLGPESTLRKCFESNENLAAIPCYVDDQTSIAQLIQQHFLQKHITYETGLIPLLINYISTGDRSLILNELEKIFLFLNGKNHIVANDLNNYLELQGEITFDRLCYTISLKQSGNVELLITKLQNEGHNLVSIIRAIIRHFTRMYQVTSLIEEGKSEQIALSSLRPPIFFKQTNEFTKSIKLWNKENILNFLKRLNELELSAKQKPLLAELALKKTIIEGIYNVT